MPASPAPPRMGNGRESAASIRVHGAGSLRALRAAVMATGSAAGLPEQRRMDMAMAANEIATNAIVHGGGTAVVRIGFDGDRWSCDVIDDGPGLGDTAAGVRSPDVLESGFGIWIARQAADEFEVIPREHGLHVRLAAHVPPTSNAERSG